MRRLCRPEPNIRLTDGLRFCNPRSERVWALHKRPRRANRWNQLDRMHRLVARSPLDLRATHGLHDPPIAVGCRRHLSVRPPPVGTTRKVVRLPGKLPTQCLSMTRSRGAYARVSDILAIKCVSHRMVSSAVRIPAREPADVRTLVKT